MTRRRRGRFRVRSGPAGGAWLACLALLCLAGGAPAAAPRRPGLDREARAIAERLYEQLERARGERRDRAVLELAFELVDRYARFADNDRVLLEAARSAWRLGDRPLARQLLGELRDGWPESRLLGEATALAGELEAGLPTGAVAPAAASVPPAAAAPSAAAPSAPAPVALPAPAAATAPRLPSDFAPVAPAALPPGGGALATVDPGLIGVLCPLTGEESAAGAAFAAGAELAAARAARDGWRPVRLLVADTGGDPAAAALAARRLVLGGGVVALVGAVGAGPTAAAAAVADAWRVPFVAPAGGSPALREFGPAVVPTGLVEGHDARLLARLAVSVERRSRAAVLYPDTPEGARACAAFVMALRESGGRLVATAACAPDGGVEEGTLRRLAEARPEALYLPLAPAAAARLVPRLAVVPTGALLLGPSGWDVAGASGLARALPPDAVCAAADAVWPQDWLAAFAAGWPAAAPAGAEPGADAVGRQAYLAVRLVVEAMADCGLTPARDSLGAALGARWLRLREAPVGEAEAAREARSPREGRFMPRVAPAPVAVEGE